MDRKLLVGLGILAFGVTAAVTLPGLWRKDAAAATGEPAASVWSARRATAAPQLPGTAAAGAEPAADPTRVVAATEEPADGTTPLPVQITFQRVPGNSHRAVRMISRSAHPLTVEIDISNPRTQKQTQRTVRLEPDVPLNIEPAAGWEVDGGDEVVLRNNGYLELTRRVM